MIWQQMFRFGLVGGLATCVHMVVGFTLIQSNLPPLTANLIAFVIAFSISFIGHLGFSFADQNASISSSIWKFVIVSITGFLINQVLLAWLLSLNTINASVSMLVSTGCAAILTFVLSKRWAFREPVSLDRLH